MAIADPFRPIDFGKRGNSAPTFRLKSAKHAGQSPEDSLVLALLRSLASREGLNLTKEAYCEIGIRQAVVESTSQLLHRQLGMTGVLVNANPASIAKLAKSRPYDKIKNVVIVPDNAGYEEFGGSIASGLPGSSRKLTAVNAPVPTRRAGKNRVNEKSLSRFLCDEFGGASRKPPLFVSIGIEGPDYRVIENCDFVIRPYIVQIRASRDLSSAGFSLVAQKLKKNGYSIIAQTDVCQVAVDGARLNDAHSLNAFDLGGTGFDQLLLNCRVLSLDVFDTILARRCCKPVDVFAWIEKKYSIENFCQERVSAEALARERFAQRGAEVSLAEIYEQLSERIPLPAGMMARELEAEQLFLYANPDILKIISNCRARNIRVIAVSDMYLSSKQIAKILSAAGVEVDAVYSSCDFRSVDVGKYNGRIFGKVLEAEKVDACDVLHIGDNPISDIARAAEWGICVLPVRHLHRQAVAENPQLAGLDHLAVTPVGSFILGQVTRNLVRSPLVSPISSFGYAYGGPLILGFVLHILAHARANGIKRLLLLERDGHIIKNALTQLGVSDISFRTIPSSRRLCVFPRAATRGFDGIKTLFGGQERLTEKRFFEILSIAPPPGVVADNMLEMEASRIYAKHQEFLSRRAGSEYRALKKMLTEELSLAGSDKKLAWVDVGWALSSVRALNDILGQAITCICVGSHEWVAEDVPHVGYLFERGRPQNYCKAIMQGLEVIELIFSSTHEQCAWMRSQGSSVQAVSIPKSAPAKVRDGYVAEIWAGACMFIRDFADLVPGVDLKELRTFNQLAFEKLALDPPPGLYASLASIPHDRYAGNGAWNFVGTFWKLPKPALAEQIAGSQRVRASFSAQLKALGKRLSELPPAIANPIRARIVNRSPSWPFRQ